MSCNKGSVHASLQLNQKHKAQAHICKQVLSVDQIMKYLDFFQVDLFENITIYPKLNISAKNYELVIH